MAAPRTLLAGAVDYAGLFPPAALSLEAATDSYQVERSGPDAWALGRFVVPVARLGELARVLPGGLEPWPLSVVVGGGGDPVAERDLLTAGEALLGGRAVVEAVELRAVRPEEVAPLLASFPGPWERFVEVPLGTGTRALLEAVKRGGAAAKLRTGGLTADAFPDPDVLLDGLSAVVHLELRFKCTAGLHHPVRGQYPLTYAPGAPTGEMYGYLNVMGATLALRLGWDRAVARDILTETDPGAFDLCAPGWRGRGFPAAALDALRRESFLGFGSCSFREPVGELATLVEA